MPEIPPTLIVRCTRCHLRLNESRMVKRLPCPRCRDRRKQVELLLTDTIGPIYDHFGLKQKNDSYPSAKKVRVEMREGVTSRRDGKGLVYEEKYRDKDADIWREKVVDIQTGEILVDKNVSLREHQGFGYAKFRKLSSDA